ncbi:MAG: R-phenyllactate dehydratase activator [Syntrophorhabdus sp. PtaU1.Bin058]|nr:MAG: R-phenyllactate dehydratase activator [Syntrophorhabdus sp. PtaU1.Bin058]
MYFGGIDIGSVAAKFLIMDEYGKVVAYVVENTIPDVDLLSMELREKALRQARLRKEDLLCMFSTGYGRHVVSFAEKNLTEIICHATGVHKLFPTVRTIIDIGGQDSKAIRLDDTGRILNFAMNSKCAAGTGRFTEVMSKALGIEFERWGEVVASAGAARTKISNICTIFAESEVISKIMQKVPLNQILAGICESIVARVFETINRMGGVFLDVAFTGGVARNMGIRQILEERIKAPLCIPEIPQSTGALGAAYRARDEYLKSKHIPPVADVRKGTGANK